MDRSVIEPDSSEDSVNSTVVHLVDKTVEANDHQGEIEQESMQHKQADAQEQVVAETPSSQEPGERAGPTDTLGGESSEEMLQVLAASQGGEGSGETKSPRQMELQIYDNNVAIEALKHQAACNLGAEPILLEPDLPSEENQHEEPLNEVEQKVNGEQPEAEENNWNELLAKYRNKAQSPKHKENRWLLLTKLKGAREHLNRLQQRNVALRAHVAELQRVVTTQDEQMENYRLKSLEQIVFTEPMLHISPIQLSKLPVPVIDQLAFAKDKMLALSPDQAVIVLAKLRSDFTRVSEESSNKSDIMEGLDRAITLIQEKLNHEQQKVAEARAATREAMKKSAKETTTKLTKLFETRMEENQRKHEDEVKQWKQRLTLSEAKLESIQRKEGQRLRGALQEQASEGSSSGVGRSAPILDTRRRTRDRDISIEGMLQNLTEETDKQGVRVSKDQTGLYVDQAGNFYLPKDVQEDWDWGGEVIAGHELNIMPPSEVADWLKCFEQQAEREIQKQTENEDNNKPDALEQHDGGSRGRRVSSIRGQKRKRETDSDSEDDQSFARHTNGSRSLSGSRGSTGGDTPVRVTGSSSNASEASSSDSKVTPKKRRVQRRKKNTVEKGVRMSFYYVDNNYTPRTMVPPLPHFAREKGKPTTIPAIEKKLKEKLSYSYKNFYKIRIKKMPTQNLVNKGRTVREWDAKKLALGFYKSVMGTLDNIDGEAQGHAAITYYRKAVLKMIGIVSDFTTFRRGLGHKQLADICLIAMVLCGIPETSDFPQLVAEMLDDMGREQSTRNCKERKTIRDNA